MTFQSKDVVICRKAAEGYQKDAPVLGGDGEIYSDPPAGVQINATGAWLAVEVVSHFRGKERLKLRGIDAWFSAENFELVRRPPGRGPSVVLTQSMHDALDKFAKEPCPHGRMARGYSMCPRCLTEKWGVLRDIFVSRSEEVVSDSPGAHTIFKTSDPAFIMAGSIIPLDSQPSVALGGDGVWVVNGKQITSEELLACIEFLNKLKRAAE